MKNNLESLTISAGEDTRDQHSHILDLQETAQGYGAIIERYAAEVKTLRAEKKSLIKKIKEMSEYIEILEAEQRK